MAKAGKYQEFDDRQTTIDAANEPYIPYEYNNGEENTAWAGALPIKQ